MRLKSWWLENGRRKVKSTLRILVKIDGPQRRSMALIVGPAPTNDLETNSGDSALVMISQSIGWIHLQLQVQGCWILNTWPKMFQREFQDIFWRFIVRVKVGPKSELRPNPPEKFKNYLSLWTVINFPYISSLFLFMIIKLHLQQQPTFNMRTTIAILALFAFASLVVSAPAPSFKQAPWAYEVFCTGANHPNYRIRLQPRCCRKQMTGRRTSRQICKGATPVPKTCKQRQGTKADYSEGYFRCCHMTSHGIKCFVG